VVALDLLVPDVTMQDFSGHQLNFDDIVLEKKIGKGAFGDIYRATYQDRPGINMCCVLCVCVCVI
jgi:hypothetical protein